MVSRPGHTDSPIKEAIILAGGFGTRLRDSLGDIPKPLAPIDNKPFLAWLISYLKEYGIDRVILATGYKHDLIHEFFGKSYSNSEILYSVEDTPLGTGGAILKASGLVKGSDFFVFNGDTWFSANLAAMSSFYRNENFKVAVALKEMEKFSRYGRVEVEGDSIVSFREKEYCERGLINGGVYITSTDWIEANSPGPVFSFEKEILEKYASSAMVGAYLSDGWFIDIGIPSDYEIAKTEIPKQFAFRNRK
jgi:D-glycero-alpha-D-manno-heptose 1-phosphate guanylyltransferase